VNAEANSPCVALLDPFQRNLLTAFEESVPISGLTGIFFRNPKAPSLLLSRSPDANAASHADLGEKILRQFSFLPGMDLNEPLITALELFNSGR